MLKTLTFLFLSLFLISTLISQESKQYSIEINTLRFAVNEGLDVNGNFGNVPSLFNGITFGVQGGRNFKFKLGVRRLLSFPSHRASYSYEVTRIRGGEVSLGVEYLKPPSRNFYLSYEANLIYEHANHYGNWDTDTQLAEEVLINNKKQFIGVGAKLNFNVSITENVTFVVSPRVKFGQNRIQKNRESTNYWIDGNQYQLYFEPINNMGLAFHF